MFKPRSSGWIVGPAVNDPHNRHPEDIQLSLRRGHHQTTVGKVWATFRNIGGQSLGDISPKCTEAKSKRFKSCSAVFGSGKRTACETRRGGWSRGGRQEESGPLPQPYSSTARGFHGRPTRCGRLALPRLRPRAASAQGRKAARWPIGPALTGGPTHGLTAPADCGPHDTLIPPRHGPPPAPPPLSPAPPGASLGSSLSVVPTRRRRRPGAELGVGAEFNLKHAPRPCPPSKCAYAHDAPRTPPASDEHSTSRNGLRAFGPPPRRAIPSMDCSAHGF